MTKEKNPLKKETENKIILFKNSTDTQITIPKSQQNHQKSHFLDNAKHENIEIFHKEQLKITSFNKIKALIAYIIRLIFCCFFRGNRRVSMAKIATKTYNSSILNFFKHLLWILRVMRYFRDRTIYKSIRRIKDFHLFLINDSTYFKSEEGEESTGITRFFSNSLIRKMIRLVKKKLKFFSIFLQKLESKFFFLNVQFFF